MKTLNKYIGLDVHKDTTVIAVAEEGRAGEVGGIFAVLASFNINIRSLTPFGSS